MITTTPLSSWLSLAAGFCAAANIVHATSQLAFKDTWHDAGAYDSVDQFYYVNTTGSFSTSISLPLDGVDLSESDVGTMVTLAIGPVGSTTQVISDTLGDVTYIPGKHTATFPIIGQDNSGNPTTNGNVTVTWTSTTITVSGSASLDVLGEEPLFAGNSDGEPTNSPINGFYEVMLTMDASDNGGGVFNYDNPFVPVTGSDRESEYNPPDGSGPYPLENGSVTGTGDFAPPKLSITSPAAGFKAYNQDPVIDLKGLASDILGVTDVYCFVNGDTNNPMEIDQVAELPTNSIAWTISDLDLSQVGQPGSNVVTVIAYDSLGYTASVSRTFFYILTNSAVLTVTPPNAGTIKGIKNGQTLQQGSSYSVTAVPASTAWLFSQWTDDLGNVLSSNATFEYFDTDGVLTATFEANPFNATGLAGTYTGLYYDTNDESVVRDDGYITVTVTDTGAYTGKIYNADYSKATGTLSGHLSVAPGGSFAAATSPLILFGKSNYLQVNLQIAIDPVLTDPGAGLMTGFVNSFDDKAATNLTDSAQIMGELSYYNTNVRAGLYNFVIQPVSGDPSQGPGGFSYGTATVSKKGAVAVVLNLADGVSPTISFASALAQDGSCPIYAALYGGNAVLLGWMQFATDGSGNISPANMTWFTENYNDALLPRGTAFSGQPLLFGGLYVPPKAGTNLFGNGVTTLILVIDPGYTNGLSLPAEIDLYAVFNPAKNTFSYANNTNKASIALTTSSGALTGSFVYPAGGRTSFTFHGVVANGAGVGFYTDPANKETGPIWIVPPDPRSGFSSSGESGESVSTGNVGNSIIIYAPSNNVILVPGPQ